MATHIKYNYVAMEATAVQLDSYAGKLEQAAEALKNQMGDAVADWTGPSKDAFMEFFTNYAMPYLKNDVPAVATALAKVLRENMQNMGDADAAIAQNVPKSK